MQRVPPIKASFSGTWIPRHPLVHDLKLYRRREVPLLSSYFITETLIRFDNQIGMDCETSNPHLSLPPGTVSYGSIFDLVVDPKGMFALTCGQNRQASASFPSSSSAVLSCCYLRVHINARLVCNLASCHHQVTIWDVATATQRRSYKLDVECTIFPWLIFTSFPPKLHQALSRLLSTLPSAELLAPVATTPSASSTGTRGR